MSDGKRRINIIIHPDGSITAGSEGLYGGDCLPYIAPVLTALDAVPNVPLDKAAAILSDDFYDYLPQSDAQQERERRSVRNIILEQG